MFMVIKMEGFIKSFKYAFQGVLSALKCERNIKIHYIAMILVIFFGITLKISKLEWIICIILFGLIISLEMVNTAIEKIVDMITKEKNNDAKVIKDISAGAVLILAICSAIIGIVIFFPKVMLFFKF